MSLGKESLLFFLGGHDEKYLIKDSYDQLYKLRLKDPVPSYAEVLSHIFLEALGLPNTPVYPVIVKRGENGIPYSEEAKELFKEDAYRKTYAGLSGAHNNYVPATAQNKISIQHYELSSINSHQMAEFLGHLLVHYILGNQHLKMKPRSEFDIVFTGKHFTTIDMTQAFRFYEEESKREPFLSYFQHFPFDLKGLNEEERRIFLRKTNIYLSRIESFSEKTLESLFHPLFKVYESNRKNKKLPHFDFSMELQRRIKGLRNHLVESLRGSLRESDLLFLKGPLQVSKANINIPKLYIENTDKLPSAKNHNPVDLLWSFFFQSFYKLREQASKKWAKELNFDGDVIKELKKRAQKDTSKIYFVSPHLNVHDYINQKNKNEADPPQVYLNPKNKDTLVVVPLNDREALEVKRIARLSGAEILPVSEKHGVRLSEELVEKIIETAKKDHLSRVLIMEIPPKHVNSNNDLEKKIEESVLNLRIIDHHNYAHLNRTQPSSSLEQTARYLGWKLSLVSKAIGVNDGSFIGGLLDLGLKEKDMEIFYPKQKDRDYIFKKLTEIYKTAEGEKLFLGLKINRAIGSIVGTAISKAGTKNVSVIVFDSNKVAFSGNPAIAQSLFELSETFRKKGQAKDNYSGGDRYRSMFWGLKGVDPASSHEVFSKIIHLLERFYGENARLNEKMYPKINSLLEEKGKELKKDFQLKQCKGLFQ